MATYENVTAVLNDLVKINNDRIEGYEKATVQTNDSDLKTLFTQMANESRQYVNELNQQLSTYGKDIQTDSTVSGKIYRTWMDVKRAFTGDDRHAILSSCEYGEDAAQRAYQEALESDEPLPNDVYEVISAQKAALKRSHDIIKQQRDLEKVTH
ncbi:MAG TPA: PA2169 family four-helix-bundle protein [Chitinophaga sp.]